MRRIVALALVLCGTVACEPATYTVAGLKERGSTMDGRRVGLTGEVTHPAVPRTRRRVRVAGSDVDLQAFELRDSSGRIVVWYDPARLEAPLQRGDRVEIDASVSVPLGSSARSADITIVAQSVRRVTE